METKFLIIDGNSLACRAAFAHNPKFGPDLTTIDGKLTGGTYRFFTMLDKLLHQLKPTHVLVAWDVGRKTFRHEIYPDYKANREKKNDELFVQFSDIKKILNAVGIKNEGIIGFEGDDVVGTYIKQSKATKNFIISGDKDGFQLVNDNTWLLFPKNGFKEIEFVSPEYILNKYDVPVEKFIDLKALMGDKGDNIPGIEGCAEKTAAKLLNHYGSAKAVAATNGEIDLKGINKKVKDGIQDWIEKSDLIIDLVTIRQDVPIQYSFDQCAIDLNWENARELFQEFEFRSFIKKLNGGEFYNVEK